MKPATNRLSAFELVSVIESRCIFSVPVSFLTTLRQLPNNLYSPYGPYGLYIASVPVKG